MIYLGDRNLVAVKKKEPLILCMQLMLLEK